MRNAVLLRWIEQAEARQVITTALFDRAPKPPWSSVAGDRASQWLPRLGSWLAARHPMGLSVPQVQPALIHGPVGLPERYRSDDEGYSCYW
jgi:hypothetical protein